MKRTIFIIIALLFLTIVFFSSCCKGQITPFASLSGGYMSNGKGVAGIELGAESRGLILAGDIRVQSSSEPVLFGFKTGWYKPLDDCYCKAFSIMGGVYSAKKNNHTKEDITPIAFTGTIRYYNSHYFFIEGVYQYSEQRHLAGIGIGMTGWID